MVSTYALYFYAFFLAFTAIIDTADVRLRENDVCSVGKDRQEETLCVQIVACGLAIPDVRNGIFPRYCETVGHESTVCCRPDAKNRRIYGIDQALRNKIKRSPEPRSSSVTIVTSELRKHWNSEDYDEDSIRFIQDPPIVKKSDTSRNVPLPLGSSTPPQSSTSNNETGGVCLIGKEHEEDWYCAHIVDCRTSMPELRELQMPNYCGSINIDPIVCCRADRKTMESNRRYKIPLKMNPQVTEHWPSSDYDEDSIHFVQDSTRKKPTFNVPNVNRDAVLQNRFRSSSQSPRLPVRNQLIKLEPLEINKSNTKCNEYKNMLCGQTATATRITRISAWDPLLCSNSWALNNLEYCNNLTGGREHYPPYVAGGSNASPGEYPHMARIGFLKDGSHVEWRCSGALISERYVLTSAHCSWARNLGNARWVRLGEFDLSSARGIASPTDFRITEIIVHPNYRFPSFYNDIALFKLDREVTFTKYVRPICLNSVQDETRYTTVTATGWDRTALGEQVNPTILAIDLNMVATGECRNSYGVDKKYSSGLDINTMICAGGKDACLGDYGAPLQIKSESCLYTQVGITSFGRGCAHPSSPAVYTRISRYIPWIESVVWS